MRLLNMSGLVLKLRLTLSIFLIGFVLQAREFHGPKSKTQNSTSSKAAGCAPAETFTDFFVNNVRTGAETGGNTWYDRGNGNPYYEIPEGGGNHVIFAGALWMGGVDPAGNLKLAGITYRQNGNDFWPGPLSIDGSASIEFNTCKQWDNFYLMSRQLVQIHRLYFTLLAQGEDPSTNPLFEDGYSIPEEILDWPASGEAVLGQSETIAPFKDFRDPVTNEIAADNIINEYEPTKGDYPFYDLEQDIDCRTRLVTDVVPLFGDVSMFWVFNDKGNVHTESQGEPIGMEIQAQMFGFSTNDEINNMNFCNYVLINRGSLTLEDTYFAQFVDSDVGFERDDYIGCDVGRGLGYSYNGVNFDPGSQQSGGSGYGDQPPAVGVDFFEGPYQDPDGINNLYGIGPNEALNGLGYLNPDDFDPDSIIDNERFGMRRFLYFSNSSSGAPSPTQDPNIAIDFYNYMRGIWKNGVLMSFGGTGYVAPNLPQPPATDFMFPGTSDPLHWGTEGIDPGFPNPEGWTEVTAGTQPEDRRFLQSAGPFTLDPGEFNNITVGVVYARAQSGGAFASVIQLRQADDKAQSLFENCFRLLEGPDAPDLTAQELDREIILYLRNTSNLSNNRNEAYEERDPTIPPFSNDSADGGLIPFDRLYRFQGYQVFQLKNSNVKISDIDKPELARLVYQGDIRDFDENGQPIGQLVNYINDPQINLPVPVEQVNGANNGVAHSIKITEDAFAQGGSRLVNFKKYYFIAVAYGYNNYQDYNPQPEERTGQARPYLRGRGSAGSGSIESIVAIPHKPVPEKFGTVFTAEYGDGLPITRIEGAGNGSNILELDSASLQGIVEGPIYKKDEISYLPGKGPIDVFVVDPLNVKPSRFELKFYNNPDGNGGYEGDIEDARWFMVDLNNPTDTIFSERTIRTANEQIIPEYGIAVSIGQADRNIVNTSEDQERYYRSLLGSSISFTAGPTDWLAGVSDTDGQSLLNWIRSGRVINGMGTSGSEASCWINSDDEINDDFWDDYTNVDDEQIYEDVVNGTFAPAILAAQNNCGPGPMTSGARGGIRNWERALDKMTSMDLYITPNKSLWSRSPIFELQSNQDLAQARSRKLYLRGALSVDKNGRSQLDPDANVAECTFNGAQVLSQADVDALSSTEKNDLLVSLAVKYPQITEANQLVGLSFGMGYFPGYAVDPGTGERRNVAFGENSHFVRDNGADMLWNPSSRIFSPLGDQAPFGGEHYIYIFRNQAEIEDNELRIPGYDGGQLIYQDFKGSLTSINRIYRALEWVGFPLLNPEFSFRSPEDGLVPGEVHVSISVGTPYRPYATAVDELGDASLPYVPVTENYEASQNSWYPMYRFSTESIATVVNNAEAGTNALDLIDIVPNPYYAYSAYEQGRIDNRVKFVNLPPECKIQIFTINGNLIRILEKDNPNTFLEWNLQNEAFIPISGGMYLIHVQSPGLGDRVLKFFAATRPADLRNF